FVPAHAVPAKVEAIRALGAEVHFVPGGYEQAEQRAIEYARQEGKTWVSPYNDPQVIAGQGTLGREIIADLAPGRVLTIVVPVGGGGMLAGIGAALEKQMMRPRLVGVSAEASAFMYSLYHRGTQQGVMDLPTLADGLSGAIEPNSLTISLVKKYADDFLTVSEDEIGRAIVFAWRTYGQIIEGSGAVGLAAFLAGKVAPPALVVISGGNIQPEVHADLCRRYGEGQV
ncbi:MAG: pyridoxal-phosphate dependent enzyme, partial [Anaerolineales bacterium]|nr:pyridoxal-phosphate dependent enzyme [Anaerolineales bacterium]